LQLTALAGRLGSLGGGPEVHAGTGAADGPGGGQPSPARGVRAHGPRPASHHDRDRGAAAPCTASSIGLNGSNIETVSAGLDDVAFLNPDGTKVLVAYNNSNAAISFGRAVGRSLLHLHDPGAGDDNVLFALGSFLAVRRLGSS
jgi:hypothetical protein